MKLNQYCAFLRCVNVKGTNMKMAELSKVFEAAGMTNVITVLASGNVIFSTEQKKETLKQKLENAISSHFNYEAFLFVKDKGAIASILKNNPFTAHQDYHIYAFVGIDGIEQKLMSEFAISKKSMGENAQNVDHIFFWQIAKGNTLETEFGKILGDKNLKNCFTSRNLNTIEKIMKKM